MSEEPKTQSIGTQITDKLRARKPKGPSELNPARCSTEPDTWTGTCEVCDMEWKNVPEYDQSACPKCGSQSFYKTRRTVQSNDELKNGGQ